MVKYFVQNLNGDLKIAYVGDLDGLRKKIKDELEGDKDTAIGNLKENIEKTKVKIAELEVKNKENISEEERIKNDCGITNGRLAILNNEQQIEKIKNTNTKDLVFFELTPVEL